MTRAPSATIATDAVAPRHLPAAFETTRAVPSAAAVGARHEKRGSSTSASVATDTAVIAVLAPQSGSRRLDQVASGAQTAMTRRSPQAAGAPAKTTRQASPALSPAAPDQGSMVPVDRKRM